jgi:GGDEF domain-containing protein
MPAHHPDDRTAERIEAFFDGTGLADAPGGGAAVGPRADDPSAPRTETGSTFGATSDAPSGARSGAGPRAVVREADRRAAGAQVGRRVAGTVAGRTLLDGFDTRSDWLTALRQESARVVRYGRPAAVVIVDLARLLPAVATDRYAREAMTVIRDGARETDRGARMTTSRIHVLLPETTAREAQHVAKRIATDIRAKMAGRVDPANVRIEIASARRDTSLEDALADAERRLAG